MGIKLNILLILIAATIPHLYSRLSLLYRLETSNHPSKLSTPRGWVSESGDYEVLYKDVLRNCEDVVMDARAGYAVLGCDEGRDGWNTVMGVFASSKPKDGSLYLHDYSRTPPTLESLRLLNTPPSYSFHPLGLSLHIPTSTLLVVNHATSGSTLDLFHFSRLGNSASYIRSISSPFLRAPNAVVQLNGKEALVSNDHFFTARNWPLMSKLETFLGLPLGSIAHVNLETGQVVQLARVGFANGMALLNDSTLAVASSSNAKVLVFELDKTTTPPTLTKTDDIAVPFFPDNLHVSGDKLFIAGHPHLSSFSAFTKQRALCRADISSRGCDAVAPSYVVEWTAEQGLRDVYVGTEIVTSSGMAFDGKRGVGIVSGLYGKGILVWRAEGGDAEGVSRWRDVDGRV